MDLSRLWVGPIRMRFLMDECYLMPPRSLSSSFFLSPARATEFPEVPGDEAGTIFLGSARDSCWTEGRSLSLIVLQYFTFTFFVEIRLSSLKNSSFFVNPLFAITWIGYIHLTSEMREILRIFSFTLKGNTAKNLFDSFLTWGMLVSNTPKVDTRVDSLCQYCHYHILCRSVFLAMTLAFASILWWPISIDNASSSFFWHNLTFAWKKSSQLRLSVEVSEGCRLSAWVRCLCKEQVDSGRPLNQFNACVFSPTLTCTYKFWGYLD